MEKIFCSLKMILCFRIVSVMSRYTTIKYFCRSQRIDLDFCLVPLDKLRNSLKDYHTELISIVLEDKQEITHFIYKGNRNEYKYFVF